MPLSNIRRQHGYDWEKTVKERLLSHGWHAWRLGGSTTDMPDIFGVHDSPNMAIAIECKTGLGKHLYVPADQVTRCMDMVNAFWGKYNARVILAFRFRRITGKRKPVEYFRMVNYNVDYRMTDDGTLEYKSHAGKWVFVSTRDVPDKMLAGLKP